ncbi:CBS domain-containing protein [Jiangella asiatica]|nr:CBS domain-containing protein [Jiangella asiatica]
MTEQVMSVPTTAPVRQAAEVMRDNDIGDVVVVDDGVVRGVLTDRDMVIRVLADNKEPNAVTVGEVYSANVVVAQADTTIDDAVRAMRDRAVRRLPVVDREGRPVGVVSIGDFARSEDPHSALADISDAPPNT